MDFLLFSFLNIISTAVMAELFSMPYSVYTEDESLIIQLLEDQIKKIHYNQSIFATNI